MTAETLDDLHGPLWEHFQALSRIPRPSRQEARARDYVAAVADSRNLRWAIDEIGNIVVYLPATPGMEKRDTVIVQNHLDMVTVQARDKVHDFTRDPLQLRLADGWLLADRTTLGADNGIGCAAALALISASDLVHPALELLFTVDEETGMGGARHLDAELLCGKRLLNLDTEDWGELYIGCTGGRGWSMECEFGLDLVPDDHVGGELSLVGLAGGHSGLDIHLQRGNAIQLLADWLNRAGLLGVRLAQLDAGIAHNVIPRDGRVRFSCPGRALPALRALNDQLLQVWRSYLPEADAALQLSMESVRVERVLPEESQTLLCRALLMLPHGVERYATAQAGTMASLSSNLGVARLEDGALYIELSLRYFRDSEAESLTAKVLSVSDSCGFSTARILNYPGWVPDSDSQLLQRACEVYQRRFGEPPRIKLIHAGLECGVLKHRLGELEVISFGPTIRDAHSPGERLEVATVAPFWQYLTDLLATL